MKENIFRVVSKFQLHTADSPELGIDYFLENLLDDLKRVSLIDFTKVATTVLPFKWKILKVRLSESEHLIVSFNDIVKKTNEDWEAILKKWYSPRSLNLTALLVKGLNNLKKEYNISLYDLSILAASAIKNLQYIELNYELEDSEQKSIDEKVEKLTKLSLLNYDSFMRYLKSGKLPIL